MSSTRWERATRCSPTRRSPCYSSGNPLIASVLGSLAAAVECEHEGNVPVSPKNVTDKLERVERLANFR